MKNIKGIALILFAFVMIFASKADASCNTLQAIPIPVNNVVSYINSYEDDIIAPKTSENIFSLNENSEQIYNYRQNNNHFNYGNSDIPVFQKQFQTLLSYLYSKSFLELSKNNISQLLFQIQPNAP